MINKDQKPLILSISKKRLETQMSSNNERIANERQSQTIITRSFNARRNSGQIERYFIESHTVCCITFLVIISTLILFGVISLILVMPRAILKSKVADMTEKIVFLTQAEIMRLISADLNLSFFYSFLFSSLMSPPEIITPDLYSARDIVKVFAKAYRTNENNKIWRLGISDGRFIGFNTENGIKLLYSKTSGNDIYPLYSWVGNPITYDNSSYPYIFYEQGDTFISYEMQWYIIAETEKRTCWTPLSTGVNKKNKLTPVISTASPVFDQKTGEISNVFSIGVHIEQTQLFFDYFLQSPNSRFALINSGDYKKTIIACTGDDLPYEEINNMLSFKTLLELQDDLWRHVVSDNKFENEGNFTFVYNREVIHCVHAAFEMAPGIKWSFLSAFSVNDIVNADINIVDQWSVIFFCIFCIICIIIEVSIVVLNNAVSIRQSKILKTKEKKDKDMHIKYSGISAFIKKFQHLLLSHADNSDINNNVEIIINDLVNSPKLTFFDSYQMVEGIEDSRVKNKFIEMFGLPASGSIKGPDKLSKNDTEIINNYEEKRESRNPAFTRLNKESKSIEKKIEKAISLRHDISILKKEKIIKKIVFFVQSYNLINPLFDPDQLDIIIQKIILNISDQTLPLLYDSFELAFILMKRNAQSLIIDPDYSLALNFALFSYHMSMSKRTDYETPLIDKFYQRSIGKISQESHAILFGLFKILIDRDEVHLERWEKFKNIVFDLIKNGAELRQHRNYFDMAKLVFDVAEKTHARLTIREAYIVIFFIYCVCQFSFYFHKKNDCYSLMRTFVPIDSRPRPPQMSKFISCMITQYLQPMTITLDALCGADFVDWIRHSVESSAAPPKNTKVFV